MRFTPLLGSKVWFGPRRFGWGWDPVSWEGWASIGGYLVVCIALPLAVPERWALPAVLGATAAFVLLAILKGTPPGGPEAAERFRTWRRGQGRTPEQVEHDRRLRRDVEDEPSVTEAAARLRQVPRPSRRR